MGFAGGMAVVVVAFGFVVAVVLVVICFVVIMIAFVHIILSLLLVIKWRILKKQKKESTKVHTYLRAHKKLVQILPPQKKITLLGRGVSALHEVPT